MTPEEKISEGLSLLVEGIGETAVKIAKHISYLFSKIPKSLSWEYHAEYSTNPDIKKSYVIYKRTKSKRIKKKQQKRIIAILNK